MVHILLPVHNRRDVTARFIRCLKAQTFDFWHLILIDDGSSDGTAEMVLSEIPSATVLRGTGSWWWGGALQQGYRWLIEHRVADSENVLIVNDDTEFEADFLEIGLGLLVARKNTLLLAHAYSRSSRELLDAGMRVDWRRFSFRPAATAEEINCLSTRGLFLTIGDFKTIGGFYPRLLPHYGSDYEFTIRARRMGLQLASDPRLRLWVDQETTGLHNVQAGSPLALARKLFSKRAPGNPIYLSAFVALCCPWSWKVRNWLWIWGKAASLLLKSCLRRPDHNRS